jgi:hypothetical protein
MKIISGKKVGIGSKAAWLINNLTISKLPNKHKLCHHNSKEATPPLSERYSRRL